MAEHQLDSVENLSRIKQFIDKKWALKEFYKRNYLYCADSLRNISGSGKLIEIGSGGGFLKEFIPEVITTDVIPYKGLDQVMDATQMPFEDSSVRCFFLINTFHHIPDVEKFLSEAQRCLVPGGKIMIVDQHVGMISYFLLKYLHHEGFDQKRVIWSFDSKGPLSDANGALAWIVFRRDIEKFKMLYPRLELASYVPHSPLWYWLSGGLKNWTLLSPVTGPLVRLIEKMLLRLSKNWGSFVNIEIRKNQK